MRALRSACLLAALGFAAGGCAYFGPTQPARTPAPPCTAFKLLQRFRLADAAPCDPRMAEFKACLRAGDLLVVYLDPPRCLLTGHPQFMLFPVGHALVAFEGDAGLELLECMTGGSRKMKPEDMAKYSRIDVYRLGDPGMIDAAKLREFADLALRRVRSFDFRAMVGWNQNMRPNCDAEVAGGYSCASLAATAYFYAGANLSCAYPGWHILTPQQLVAATAQPRTRAAAPAACP